MTEDCRVSQRRNPTILLFHGHVDALESQRFVNL